MYKSPVTNNKFGHEKLRGRREREGEGERERVRESKGEREREREREKKESVREREREEVRAELWIKHGYMHKNISTAQVQSDLGKGTKSIHFQEKRFRKQEYPGKRKPKKKKKKKICQSDTDHSKKGSKRKKQ